MATLEDYFFTKNTKWFLWGLLALIIEALVFHAGIVVGSHGRMLMMESHGPGMGFEAHIPFGGGDVTLPQGFIPGGHGALGTITSVNLPTIMLTSRDGTVLHIEVSSTTLVSGGLGATIHDLQEGESIIVIGDHNGTNQSDEIDAKLIRILDTSDQQSKTVLYIRQ